MKVSVSLPPEDIEFLDTFSREHDIDSRSAALHVAVRLLRASQLEREYAAAWHEWAESGDAEAWDRVAADELPD